MSMQMLPEGLFDKQMSQSLRRHQRCITEQMNLGNQDNCKTLPLHPKETKEELQVSMVTLTQEKHPEKMNEQVEIGK